MESIPFCTTIDLGAAGIYFTRVYLDYYTFLLQGFTALKTKGIIDIKSIYYQIFYIYNLQYNYTTKEGNIPPC